MLSGFNVLIVSLSMLVSLHINIVHCAVKRLDSFENKGGGGDVIKASSNTVIELDELDPRNQAVYSSYSVVETSASSGPHRVSYTKSVYEPELFGENSEQKPIGDGKKDRKNKFKFSDEKDTSSYSPLSDDEIDSLLHDRKDRKDRKDKKDSGKKSTSEKTSSKQRRKESKERKQANKPNPPKSINEIVGHQPLQEAGSSKRNSLNGDLKKSGSLLGGIGEGSFEDSEYDKEKHYDKEGGKKSVEAHKSEAGEKAQQGYKKEQGYDKAENEKHGKEEKKALVSEKEGEKKGHVEQEKVFGEEYKGNEGEKGISVTKKGGHKKGHKKTGFHKVHHKDEYKKDEVFYDEEHDGDEHEEHAHEHEKHSKEKGGQAKKSQVDSGYHEGHGEKKGAQNKGQHFEEASGHKKEAGEEAHHDHNSEFAKKGAVKEAGKHGHVEGGGSHHSSSDHDFF